MDLKTIEEAVTARLKSKWPQGTTEFDVDKGFGNVLSNQAIAVTTERILFGAPRGLNAAWYELQPVVSVYLLFKSVRPDTRRTGVYPMVAAAAALLAGKDLGLEIEPFVPYGPIVEIYHSDIAANKMAAFRIDMKTGFELGVTDDETLEKLIMTANDYLYREHGFEAQIVELPNEEGKK